MSCTGLMAVAALFLSSPAQGQQQGAAIDTADGWNRVAALELVKRARDRREQPRGDTALRNYSAKANGYVYFYLDRPGQEETTPVKVDQIALELYWAAPNLTKQKIVGLRDADLLPNRMYYHLDHLTVVQNGFGNVIRVGDGDEVRDVPHPAAPHSDTVYDFRIADSLTINFPGQPAVRVYEVNVRPKHPKRSAMIGSIFIDRESADIVRMNFTFTPASYVDRRLDYINISLDNGLWSGRYWLPNEQYVEIRRQIPELDFVAGAVIKGRMQVSGYEFNKELPYDLFFGRTVEALPEEERRAYPFEEDIFTGLTREGLGTPPRIADLRAEALKLIRQQRLSGLPPLRLDIPNASSVFRYNRNEGLATGLGGAYVPGNSLRIEAFGGYAWGPDRPQGELGLEHSAGDIGLRLGGFYNRPIEIGWRDVVPRALNTITATFAGDDYTDVYRASGVELTAMKPLGSWKLELRGAVQKDRSFGFTAAEAPIGGDRFRRSLPVTPGTLVSGQALLGGPLASNETSKLRAELNIEAGSLRLDNALATADRANYVRPIAIISLNYVAPGMGTDFRAALSGGALLGDDVSQKRFYLGGRGTLPGYGFRSRAGDAFWLVEAEAARDIAAPWVRGRIMGAVGGINEARVVGVPCRPDLFSCTARGDTFTGASYGVGLGLFWDILRLDLWRGGSNNTLEISIKRSLWDLL